MINPYLLIAMAIFAWVAIRIVQRWRNSSKEILESEAQLERYLSGEEPIPDELILPELMVPQSSSDEESCLIIAEWLKRLSKSGDFNGAVAIARNGKPLLLAAYGVVDATGKEMLTPQSAMRLASVSKQFTAAGILVLAAQGRLSLDQSVDELITGFPYPDVTVRHLLNQTSGVPDNYMALAKEHKRKLPKIKNIGRVLSIAKAVELVNTFPGSAPAVPNSQFEYSNTNYLLLAAIVESVSCHTFENFLQNELFEPLGLQNTRVWNLMSVESSFRNQAGSFMSLADVKVASRLGIERIDLPPDFLDGVAGDGAVFSSVEDLVKWNSFWDSDKIVPQDLLQQAFRKPTLNDGSLSDYGFGWVVFDDGAWHNGSWLGVTTFVARNSTTGAFVAVLDNSMNPQAEVAARMIVEKIS